MTTTPAKPLRSGRGTRDTILDAASRLIFVKGYSATSVDDVLRESAVGKGNFYHYFKSKEDLVYAILDRAVRAFVDRTLEPCFSDPGVSRLVQIRCFIDHLVEIQRRGECIGGCLMGNLASELSDVHEGLRNRLAEVFGHWRTRLTTALVEGQERGEVSARCAPAAVAQFLVASLEGAILMTKLTKDIRVMEQCVTELTQYLSLYGGAER